MAEGGSKLTEEQIFECLKSLNVPVRMNDLKVPTREFIIRVFDCFLRDLQIDTTSEKLRTWEATNHIEDGDIYEEAQLLIILATSVNHITDPCGLNITIKDLIEPKPKRTKKILNYLIVFWNYYLQKYGRFLAIEKTFDNERKKADDLALENESLDEKYNDKLSALNSLQPSKEELLSMISSREEKASKLKAESETLQTEYQNLKTKEINLKEKISATDLDIIKARERLDELSQLILSSPKQKQIKTEIQVLEEKIKVKDVAAKEFESKYREEVKKLQLLDGLQKEEEKVLKTLNETDEITKHLRDTIKTMIDIHQKINEEEDKVKRLQMDLDRKEDWRFKQDQKSAQVTLNNKKQVETLKEVLKMNQNEEAEHKKNIECMKIEVKDVQDSIDSESDRILDVIRECKEADARSKERETQHVSKVTGTKNQFKHDCNDVMEIMKTAFSNPSKN